MKHMFFGAFLLLAISLISCSKESSIAVVSDPMISHMQIQLEGPGYNYKTFQFEGDACNTEALYLKESSSNQVGFNDSGQAMSEGCDNPPAETELKGRIYFKSQEPGVFVNDKDVKVELRLPFEGPQGLTLVSTDGSVQLKSVEQRYDQTLNCEGTFRGKFKSQAGVVYNVTGSWSVKYF